MKLLPEKPILIYPSLAKAIGLEEATLLSVLDDLSRYLHGDNSQGYQWYRLDAETLQVSLSFWDSLDVQRVSQRLRDLGLILLRSAPFTQSHLLDFAFNLQTQHSQTTHSDHQPRRTITNNANPIAANWQPDQETFISLSQLNIPEHFAREQVPEFVRYWRESGEVQRSWGSKFVQHAKRQWTHHVAKLSRQGQKSTLPPGWQPSDDIQRQVSEEGIPVAFMKRTLEKFCLYHQRSGTSYQNWDMPFFSWIKEAWQRQDTPFITEKTSSAMHSYWKPNQHTVNYLNGSYGIDVQFIQECIPEFVHKWIEKKAVFSEWGRIFAEHVIEQWRFLQEGINKNPVRQAISKKWRPSADCIDILNTQSSIPLSFIESQIPEFILYWTNRGEAMHSWDNIFLRFIKQQWASKQLDNQQHQHSGKHDEHERQSKTDPSGRTQDRSIAEQLNDRSWAE